MEKKNMQKQYELTKFLSGMPGKIVGLHGRENITEFVLHDLSSREAFNFSRIGYFVDNPDFDCFKGVAGYDTKQQFSNKNVIWDDPLLFSSYMKTADFNNQVRTVQHASPKKNSVCHQDFIALVAKELQFEDPLYYCWQLKHDNHGLIIFESLNGHTHWNQDDLINGMHLLSLCPIF